jgi:hypothetical protein
MKFWKHITENFLQNINFFLFSSFGFIEQLNHMKIPCCCCNGDIIKQVESFKPYPSFSKIPRIYNKNLSISIPDNLEEIDNQYSYIISIEQQKEGKDISYFRQYLFNLYNCEKTDEEIERILIKIKNIKNIVENEILFLDTSIRKLVLETIRNNQFFYERRTKDIHIKLYRIKYNGKKSVLKCYFYFPDFAFSCNMLEKRFINEVVFQNYAETISQKYNFICPTIYSYGKIVILKSTIDSDDNIYADNKTKIKCMFILMEDMEGLSLKFGEFTPETCTNIYELDRNLKSELLSHNDLYKRNIIQIEQEWYNISNAYENKNKNKMIILDYGEATLCGTPFKDY